MKRIGTFLQLIGVAAIMIALIASSAIPGSTENLIAVAGVLVVIVGRLITAKDADKGILETAGVFRRKKSKSNDPK